MTDVWKPEYYKNTYNITVSFRNEKKIVIGFIIDGQIFVQLNTNRYLCTKID